MTKIGEIQVRIVRRMGRVRMRQQGGDLSEGDDALVGYFDALIEIQSPQVSRKFTQRDH